MKLSLDCDVAVFFSPSQLVISLKGEPYVFSLVVDSMRSVMGFYLDTCVSLACAGYLFLGSRLGNSLLLRFARREVGQARRVEREPPSKKGLDMQDTELERNSGF